MATSKKAVKTAKATAPAGDLGVEVRQSAIHGRGVFATRTIPEGATIIEYTGELITDDEIEVRYPENMKGLNHTFVFGVRDDVNIDGGVGGNESRFINHSCDPNCDSYDKGDKIFIRAAKRIRTGEELTYDYSIEAGEPLTPDLIRRWPCVCGTKFCRGTVLVHEPPKKKKAAKKKAGKKAKKRRN